MVFANLANVCSHLQNASRARLSLTSIPMTKMHLALALAMQKQGLVSTVQVAGPNPPIPDAEQPVAEAERQYLEAAIEEQPWLGLGWDASADAREIDRQERFKEGDAKEAAKPSSKLRTRKKIMQKAIRIPGVPDNPAQRRIWLGLKYWDNEPVLRTMSMVSKPTRRVTAKLPELRNLIRGVKAGITRPLVSPGECLFVSTDLGVMEVREAIERARGGCLLVKTS